MARHKTRICCCLLIFVFFSQVQESRGNAEKDLASALRAKGSWYFTGGNIHTSLNVHIDLITLHGARLDIDRRMLTLHGYMIINWTDPLWAWNPATYSNIREIRIPDAITRKPRIGLLNSYELGDFDGLQSLSKSFVQVKYTGEVTWRPIVQIEASCPLDMRHFPFDQHDCPVIFVSNFLEKNTYLLLGRDLPHNIYKMVERFKLADEPNEWSVQEMGAEKMGDLIYFHFRFTRRSAYYVISCIIPMMVVLVITSSVFWLPHDPNLKLTVGGVGILIQCILLMHLSWLAPSSSLSIPNIILVCGSSFILSIIYLFMIVIIRYISSETILVPAPSGLVKCLKGYCGSIMCIYVPPDQEKVMARYSTSVDNVTFETNPYDAQEDTKSAYNTNQRDWLLICTALDRLLFVFYCCSYVALVATTISTGVLK